MVSPVAPWHMWGTSARVNIPSIGPTQQVSQLARVNYHRPDTWRFLLWGRLTGGAVPAAAITSVWARFDLYLGVGRSVLDTRQVGTIVRLSESFCSMHWLVPVGVTPGDQAWNLKWATQTTAPPLDDSALTAVNPTVLITAEDITVSCRCLINSGDAGGTNVQLEVGAFLCPNTHVRPDWVADENPFLGGELNGT